MVIDMPNRRPNQAFSEAQITVTLTGEEWAALLGRTVRRELSLYGAQVYNRATGKLGVQLTTAQRKLNGGV